jgi:NADH-quinone oxidoreductase subunit M
MIFTMASVGLPGTSGFVGEFLSSVGTYKASTWAAIAATTGIILGAAYMLWLYWRICFGKARHADAAAMPDLSAREWALLAPIAVFVFWMGIYPETFMRPIRNDVGRVLVRVASVAPKGDSALIAGKPKPAITVGEEPPPPAVPSAGATPVPPPAPPSPQEATH